MNKLTIPKYIKKKIDKIKLGRGEATSTFTEDYGISHDISQLGVPKGWRKVKSRSRPGEYSYLNLETGNVHSHLIRKTELIDAGFDQSAYPFNYILEKFNKEEIKLAIELKKKGYYDIHIYDAINGAGMFSSNRERLTTLSVCGIPNTKLITYISNPVTKDEFSTEIYEYMDSDEHYIYCGGELVGTREEGEKSINCIRIGDNDYNYQYVGIGGYVIGALKNSKGENIQEETQYGLAFNVPTILKIISIKKGIKVDYILVCEDTFGNKYKYNSKMIEPIILNEYTDWGTHYKKMNDKVEKYVVGMRVKGDDDVHADGSIHRGEAIGEKSINCIRIEYSDNNYRYVGIGEYVIGALKNSKGENIQEETQYGLAFNVPTILKIISIKKGIKVDYILVCEDTFGNKYKYNSKMIEPIILNEYTDWGTHYKKMNDKVEKYRT